MRTPGLCRRGFQGAIGGLVATAVMSAAIAVSDWLGVMNRLPPRMIVEKILPGLPADETNAVAAIAHISYGAGAGAGYGALVRPASRNARTGILYGLVVWALSYEGWLPLLGVLPPAHRDKRGRALTMLLAHVVYGGVLGLATRPRAGREVDGGH